MPTKAMRVLSFFVLCLLAVATTACKTSERDVFWNRENAPDVIGKRVTDEIFTRHDFMIYDTEAFTGIHYAEACAAFGAARLAGLLNDQQTLLALETRYNRAAEEGLISWAHHVDATVYGLLPLELYRQTQKPEHLKLGLALADAQWEEPLANGLSSQSRHWIDDIWMIGSLQVQAFRASGDSLYLDRAALQIHNYLQTLQQPNGLFHHGERAPVFWGRGNGWVAAGLAELLSVLPEKHPHHGDISAAFVRMMEALLQHQAEDGMWRQLIDKPDSWKESSATAMFGYAMSVGVRKGLLPGNTYRPAYQKAWLALVNHIDEEGRLSEVSVGTAKSSDISYYLNRPRTTGDFHGQAPVLWFAWSLLGGGDY